MIASRPMKVVAVIPAYNEEQRIGKTVAALKSLENLKEVVVVDDGSSDATASEAEAAGASLVRLNRNRGKGGALNKALEKLQADIFLLVDADLEETAAEARGLMTLVSEGQADMAIADLPRPERKAGFGLVRKLAAWGIFRLTGFSPSEPLSGQRALRSEILPAVLPLEAGFGVEVGLTIDALRAGFLVQEVDLPLRHASTGRDLAGFAHRGRQFLAVLSVILKRFLFKSKRGV